MCEDDLYSCPVNFACIEQTAFESSGGGYAFIPFLQFKPERKSFLPANKGHTHFDATFFEGDAFILLIYFSYHKISPNEQGAHFSGEFKSLGGETLINLVFIGRHTYIQSGLWNQHW